jgi:hypothetical protein
VSRVWSERIVDAKLFHYLDSTHMGPLRNDRHQTQEVRLTRPSGAVYSVKATITCGACRHRVSYQVLSVLASRLRFALWAVLALVSTAAAVWGLVLLFGSDETVAQGEDPPGVWLLMFGLLLLGAFALLMMTETGISGPGARRSARPHSLRPVADEPDTGALTCEHCGHQEPVDGAGYLRMRQHECRN